MLAIEVLINMPSILQGIGIGIIAGIPGPISLLCIRRIITKGRLYGFISGFGVSTADIFFGGTAILGINLYSNFVRNNEAIFSFIFGSLLLLLGIKIFLSKETKEINISQEKQSSSLIFAFLSTLFITILHPGVVVFYAVSIAFIKANTNNINSITQLLGISLGSISWWIFWTLLFSIHGTSLYKKSKKYILFINRSMGVILVAAGILITFKFM